MTPVGTEHSIEDWNPRSYWSEYYEGAELESDERAMFDFCCRTIAADGRSFKTMLDLGSGPTVHRLIPFAPSVEAIHVADLDPRNREHVATWVEGGERALDWDKFFGLVIEMQGGTVTTAAIAERKAELRSKIDSIRHCDLRLEEPLEGSDRYELLTSFFCADCITTDLERWRDFMRNMLRLVAPQGRVILTALGESTGYPIGDQMFPSANLTEEDLRLAFDEAGFDQTTVQIERAALPADERRPYASLGYVLMASAKRP